MTGQGSTMGLVFWTNKEGQHCTTSLAKASETMRDLFDKWPKGLGEIDACLLEAAAALEKARLRILELEALFCKPVGYEIRCRSSSKLNATKPWGSWTRVTPKVHQMCKDFPLQDGIMFEARCLYTLPENETVNKLVIPTTDSTPTLT